MPHKRYELNRRIRIILISNRVDLDQIEYYVTADHVFLEGRLVKDRAEHAVLPGSRDFDFNAQEVNAILSDLKLIPGIKNVSVELKNWRSTMSGNLQKTT